MGFWGAGLYANDSTCDVRDTYIGFLREGIGNAEAFDKTAEKLSDFFGDPYEPFFWLAIAETQWSTGRLTPEVKAKALMWIEKNGGVELWQDSGSGGAGWLKTLKKLKLKIESPMPPEKKILQPKSFSRDKWNLNDVYAYQFHKEAAKASGFFGKYMLLQKIGTGIGWSGNVTMRIHVLDRIFDNVPSLEDICGIRILPVDYPKRFTIQNAPDKHDIKMNCLIDMSKNNEYPSDHLTYIGNGAGPANIVSAEYCLTWWDIDEWLDLFYHKWEGIEYGTTKEGVYHAL